MGAEMSQGMKRVRAMYWNQGTRIAAVFCALTFVGGDNLASAERNKKEMPVKSAKLVQTIAPSNGFVDDPFTFDRAGSRLLYVNSDTGTSSEVVVIDVLQKTKLRRVSIGNFTVKPSKVQFAIDGEHFLVWEENKNTGKQVAALISSTGQVLRNFGPAKDLVRTTYEGQDAIVIHDEVRPELSQREIKKYVGDLPTVRHTVSVHNLESGKLIGKTTNLDLTATDKNAELDFTLKFWAKDFTVAVGIKGGEWDRKEDQRSPDVEGHYVMPTRTFSKRIAIKDVRAHRERMYRMAKHQKRSQDILVRHNLSGLDFVFDGKFTPFTLSEPFHHYDSTTLVVQASQGNSMFFTMSIDPVHPDAAARRRAVKPWTDLYEYNTRTKKATRRARLLTKRGRKHSWRANSTHWAVLPRHIGFGRGGSELKIYKLK